MTLAQRLAIGAMYVAFVAMIAWTFADAVMPSHWSLNGLHRQGGTGAVQRHTTYRPASAQTLTGRVVRIADGDTLTILVDNEQHRIRLWGIDAPESKQAFGQRAKQDLSDKVFGKTVTIDVKDRDRYGRLVGVVKFEGRDINLEIVRDGLAWWYQHYARQAWEYEQAEREAKAAGRGLWADAHPEPPWDYRSEHRRRSESRATAPAGS